MSKLVSITIDPKTAKLVAVSFQGKANELGEIGNITVVRTVAIKDSAPFLRHCENFGVKNGALVSKGKDKLNDLPALDTNGAKFDNRVAIVTRFVDGNELKGFELAFANNVRKNFTYNDTMTLADWFKPTNFVVRSRDNVKHIAGKKCLLDSIPAVNIGKGDGYKARAKNKAKGHKGETDIKQADQVGKTNVDLLTLFESLGNNSLIVSLDKYTRTTEKKTVTKPGFRPLSAGVIGSSVIKHSKDDMKSNVKFKKPGMVSVPGVPGPIITYTHNDRTILKNGKNHMERVGVAIHPAHEASVMQYLRAADGIIKVKPLNDSNLALNTKTLTGNMDVDYKFYELELHGIQMMSKERARKSILDINKIAKMTERIEADGLILKAIKPIIKDLESKTESIERQRVLARFAGFSDAQLQTLKENGVNIYTGEYNGVVKVEDLSEEEQAIFKDEKVESDAIHIEYTILPNALTSLKAKELWTDGTKGMLPYVDSAIKVAKQMVEENEDLSVLLKGLKSMKDSLDTEQQKLRDELWMHKLGMLTLTGFKAVHTENASAWTISQAKKQKKGMKTYSTVVGGNILRMFVTETIELGK